MKNHYRKKNLYEKEPLSLSNAVRTLTIDGKEDPVLSDKYNNKMPGFLKPGNGLTRVSDSLISNFSNITKLLLLFIEFKDKYTMCHSINVRNISIMVAMQLQLEEKEISKIAYAAALHDIGKIAVPENILNKPSRLTPEEFSEIKKHPAQGASLADKIPEFRDLSKIILHHHERYDGGGYPAGLCGSKIPVGSRIIAVADAFDAMVNERPYRRKMTEISAVRIIKEEEGFQFDPEVAEAFLSIIFEIPKNQTYIPHYVFEDGLRYLNYKE